MKYLSVKNWDKHQSVVPESRRKEYIALHTALIDDPEFWDLPPDQQILAVKLWILRGRIGQNIPADLSYLTDRIGRFAGDDLDWLIEDGWFSYTDEKKPKKRGTKSYKKRQGYTEDFEEWYKLYPRKKVKSDAFHAWNQTEKVRPNQEEMIRKTKLYAESVKDTEEKYIKLPAGWLRDRRWEDDLKSTKKPHSRERALNRMLDAEQVEHFAHPKWKTYVSGVIAGEIKPGFKEFLSDS